MIPFIVRFLLSRGYDEASAYRYARIAFLVIVGGGILLVVFSVSSFIDSCGERRAERKIRKAEDAITTQRGVESVLTEAVNKARVNVNVAEKNVSEAKERPANTQSGNANNALKRFECEVEGKCK